MMATLIVAHRPNHLVACWDDDWRPAFRIAALPSYKAHRVAGGTDGQEDVPPPLRPQIPVIAEILAAFGLARVGCPGYEADDVIGTLTTRAVRDRRCSRVEIVTGDRDLFQLVDDAHAVRVLYTAKGGVRSPDLVTEAYLRERYGVEGGSGYADVSILRGDPSDGLPGVAGIGEKTAAALIASHGSLVALRQAARNGDPRLPPARRLRLVESADYLDAAVSVVRVVLDCPIGPVESQLPDHPADPDRLMGLVARYDLAASAGRLTRALWGN